MDSVNILINNKIETPEQQDILFNIQELINELNKTYQDKALKKSHVKINNIEYYMDGYLKSNLDDLKLAVKHKWDGVITIDGMEGSGKTKFVKSIMYYLSNGKLTIFDIYFTPEQFEEWVDKAPPESAGMWDEFVLAGLSEEALSKMQIAIIKKMTMIRKKRLYIGLLIPYIFMLRPYFAVARTRWLLHVKSPDGIRRGYFDFYNYKEKRQLYFKNKKTWSYEGVKPSFSGRFTNYEGLFINEEEYEKKKDEAIIDVNKEGGLAWKNRCLNSVKYLWTITKQEHPDLINQKFLAEIYDVSDRQIRRWINGKTE